MSTSLSPSAEASSTTATPEAEAEQPILAPAGFDQPAEEAKPEGEARDGELSLSPEGFFETFRGVFNGASMAPCVISMAQGQQPPAAALASLQVAEGDEAARKASDALYEIVQETPFLHFLIQPQSLWFKRLVALGTFGGLKIMAVAGELSERRKARHIEARREAAAAQAARDAGSGVGVQGGRYEDRGGEVVLETGQAA